MRVLAKKGYQLAPHDMCRLDLGNRSCAALFHDKLKFRTENI